MAEDLGAQIQSMFKIMYDAADLKYLRPIKVSCSKYLSSFGFFNNLITDTVIQP